MCIVNKGTVSQALAPTVLIGEAWAKQQMPLPFREPGMYLKAFGIKGVCVRIAVIIVMKGKGPAFRLWNFKSNTTNIPSRAKYAPLKASWQKPLLSSSLQPRLQFLLERASGAPGPEVVPQELNCLVVKPKRFSLITEATSPSLLREIWGCPHYPPKEEGHRELVRGNT